MTPKKRGDIYVFVEKQIPVIIIIIIITTIIIVITTFIVIAQLLCTFQLHLKGNATLSILYCKVKSHKPWILIQYLFKIGQELRKLWTIEYCNLGGMGPPFWTFFEVSQKFKNLF